MSLESALMHVVSHHRALPSSLEYTVKANLDQQKGYSIAEGESNCEAGLNRSQ